MRTLLVLVGCATSSPSPALCGQSGTVLLDPHAAEQALQWHRDARAFAIPGITLSAVGLIAGAADIGMTPHDPAWLRGTSIGLLGAGIVSSIVAYSFNVLSIHARERSVQKCPAVASRRW